MGINTKNQSSHDKTQELNIEITENFAELFEASAKNSKKEGTVTTGLVVGIENDAVLVDVGLKSEGRISLREFSIIEGMELPVIGDEVEVFIDQLEGPGGRTVLSRERAIKEKSWEKFQEIFQQGTVLLGKITGRVKGGFVVDIGGGLRAFLPGSQVDIRAVNITALMERDDQQFKIVKMDQEQGNIVVSRRVILDEARKEARSELLSNVVEGTVLDGVVKNITEYGAFVDLGPVDGLLHITDISWNKISHPSEVLSIGQTIKVIVVKYNQETQRVSLGLKQLEKNPWEGLAEKYKAGDIFQGSVTSITDYGAFVELEPGVEGLVYHTEISYNAKNVHPKKLLKTGDELSVKILEVDVAKHRISLSIKQAKPNPWELFAKEHPVGSVVEGIVTNIEHFGIFMTINPRTDIAIDVIVPVIELTWEDNPERELKKYKKDDPIKGVVINIDVARERVTISVKQFLDPRAAESTAMFNKNSVVTCSVLSTSSEGVEVELDSNTKSFIKRADLSKHRSEQRVDRFAVGERFDAKVIGFDKAAKRVMLSVKALEIEQERKAIEEYGSTDSGASLGDILGAALGNDVIAAASSNAAKTAAKGKAGIHHAAGASSAGKKPYTGNKAKKPYKPGNTGPKGASTKPAESASHKADKSPQSGDKQPAKKPKTEKPKVEKKSETAAE